MNEMKQMTTYKNSFWHTMKQSIKNFFYKWKKTSQKASIIESQNKNGLTKEEFMKIYNSVKSNNIDFNTLDKEVLYNIVLLLREEIDLLDNNLKEHLTKTEIHLFNLKMYHKQIELLNKNV